MAPTPRILVVDDEEAVRRLLTVALEGVGEVTNCESAESALLLLSKSDFDLLIVDKNLPGESGVALVRAIRSQGRDLDVIAMTGFGSVDSAVELLHLGVAAYLEKPFEDVFAVSRIVQDVLRRRRGDTEAMGHFRRATQALRGLSNPAELGSLSALVVLPVPAEREWMLRRLQITPSDKVEVAGTGAEALTKMSQTLYDLLVVDAGLTAPDACEVVEKAKELMPGAAAAVVADRPSFKLLTRLIRLDVRAVLDRPIDERQLKDRLEPVVQRLRRRSAQVR